jgi:hypothetical protein
MCSKYIHGRPVGEGNILQAKLFISDTGYCVVAHALANKQRGLR